GMLFDRPGNEGDMIGVRPYREGDRLRSIHWAQTARRDALIVTERQAAARRLVVVAVDLAAFVGRKNTDDERARQRLETAIRVAASIAQEFHAHHAEVRFVMGDIDLCLSPDTVGLHRLLDALARFEVAKASLRPPTGFGHRALVVAVTTNEGRSSWENGDGSNGGVRLVLINEEGGPNGSTASQSLRRNAWITIDSETDSSRQLRHQWERACHDSLAR
ncbi:MAG: DUF58 domain-containing protein, partial [Pirellulales bacterium]|nr:DUF58 domain-containing protein [Pirellulales bacterium]